MSFAIRLLPPAAISRRRFLAAMASGSASAALLLVGCRPSSELRPPMLPDQTAGEGPAAPHTDSVDALWDVLLPTEYDAAGNVIAAGAREAGVDHVLAGENLLRAATELGLVSRLQEPVLALFDDFGGVARAALNQALDAAAALEHPLASFATLSPAQQDAVVQRGFDDERSAPLLRAARAACWLAYLGAVTSDVGLRAVGFPAFEDFDHGVAVSGYPRMTAGAADDYTYNQAPMPTVGDDLSLIVDANGDLR
jgi:hypothetical protein